MTRSLNKSPFVANHCISKDLFPGKKDYIILGLSIRNHFFIELDGYHLS